MRKPYVLVLLFILIFSSCSPRQNSNATQENQVSGNNTNNSVENPADGEGPICEDYSGQTICVISSQEALLLTGSQATLTSFIPLVPEDGAYMVRYYGGSPAGVMGFSSTLLAGPGTYQIVSPSVVTITIFPNQ